MTNFTLEPDELDPPGPECRTPARMVSTGLAPTAEVPLTRGRGKGPHPSLRAL